MPSTPAALLEPLRLPEASDPEDFDPEDFPPSGAGLRAARRRRCCAHTRQAALGTARPRCAPRASGCVPAPRTDDARRRRLVGASVLGAGLFISFLFVPRWGDGSGPRVLTLQGA